MNDNCSQCCSPIGILWLVILLSVNMLNYNAKISKSPWHGNTDKTYFVRSHSFTCEKGRRDWWPCYGGVTEKNMHATDTHRFATCQGKTKFSPGQGNVRASWKNVREFWPFDLEVRICKMFFVLNRQLDCEHGQGDRIWRGGDWKTWQVTMTSNTKPPAFHGRFSTQIESTRQKHGEVLSECRRTHSYYYENNWQEILLVHRGFAYVHTYTHMLDAK